MSGLSRYTYREIPDTQDFEHVVSVELSEGYEWDSLEAFYSPSRRRFFWIEGSGCSCNDLWDGVGNISNLEDGNRQNLIDALRRKYDNAYGAKPTHLIDDIDTVRKFKVSK